MEPTQGGAWKVSREACETGQDQRVTGHGCHTEFQPYPECDWVAGD